jgi:hypothetical protein
MLKPFEQAPKKDWLVATGKHRPDRLAAWGSEDYTVQCFYVGDGIIRLAINRSQMILSPRYFADGITWEQLIGITRAIGYGDRWGVELYPPKRHVLNVMNVRHLWLFLNDPPLPLAAFGLPPSPKASGGIETTNICFAEWEYQAQLRRIDIYSDSPYVPSMIGAIAWEDLQAIKDAIHPDRTAVEIFEPGEDPLTPFEQRNLWVLPDRLPFEWDICPETGVALNTNWAQVAKS